MTDLAQKLIDQGIRLRTYSAGEHTTTCPRCSAQRKKPNQRKPCLSVKVDDAGGATWCCHHCGWTSNVPAGDREPTHRPASRRKPVTPKPVVLGLPDQIVTWFANRGISKVTLERNGVGYGPAYVPALEREAPAIQFPYRRRSELVNVKFRTLDKHFAQVKDAEKIFYGLDDIEGSPEIIITEGEIDKLSFEEAGLRNVLSVPDGAPAKLGDWPKDPEDDRKFDFLWNCREELKPVTKIILATDNDDPGRALAEELARRLGRERCWRITWPAINDAPRKDPNEVLVHDGPEVLREVIDNAQPYPIKNLHDLGAFESETLSLYRDGPRRALSTGWLSLDRHMKIREGELTVVTGIPGAGKSEFVDALMVNLARQFGWRFAVCSFENPPDEHIAKLSEKYLEQPFWEGPTPRMSELNLRVTIQWLREHFCFIRADDEAPTIDWILENARSAVLRHGVRGLVIDPYNEIEHKRPSTMSETEYVSQILGKVKRFGQAHDCHVWFVAHPAKMHRDANGKIPVPTLYDISGSANWANKADLGIVVHRDWRENANSVEIHVKKVRFKSVGRVGVVPLEYDVPTGCYRPVRKAGLS
jgi:twinkle protein